jgi:hypothetical protein
MVHTQWKLALAMLALLDGSPSAASADQWAADHAHGAATAASQAAHTAAAPHRAGKVSAAIAAVPRDDRHARTDHVALTNQANQLSHLSLH